jgi:hypothetical protein
MNKYLVSLVRDYTVVISAKSEDEAKELAEYYIGGEKDLSDEKDRKEHTFRIEEIEITYNDAFEIKEYEE